MVPSSDDHVKTKILKGKKLRTLTNAQLRTFNERVQLEKTYKQLTQDTVNPGRKFVKDLLINTAKQTIQNYATKAATSGLEKILTKVTTPA